MAIGIDQARPSVPEHDMARAFYASAFVPDAAGHDIEAACHTTGQR